MTTSSQKFLAGAIIGVLVVALALFTGTVFAPSPEHIPFDFTSRYVGTQAIWAGDNPYSDDVTRRVHEQMFGTVLHELFDLQRFAYPAYTAVLVTPLALLPPQPAVSLWMALQLVSVLVAPFIWLRIAGWRVKPLAAVALLVGLALLFRYPIINYLVGNFIGTMLLFLSLGVLAMRQGRDVLAGVFFAAATVPPPVSGPLAVLLLGMYALLGRWRGLAAFAITLAAASLVTVPFIGWWVPDFVNGLFSYADYAYPVWAPGLAAPAVALALVLMVLALDLFAAFRLWKTPSPENELAFIALAFPSVLILLPQTGNYYLTLLIPTVIVAMTVSRSRFLPPAILAAVSAAPWLVSRGMEPLLLPLLVLLLYLTADGQRLFSPIRAYGAAVRRSPRRAIRQNGLGAS